MEPNTDYDVIEKRARNRKRLSQTILYILLTIWAVLVCFPFYWMLLTSVKGYGEYNSEYIPRFFTLSPTLKNYADAFTGVPLGRYLLNTLIFTVITTALMLVVITLICAGFSVGFGVAMSQALGPFSLRAGVASSALGIAQVCGSSLWIWLAAVIGLNALNMLIGILIGCSMVCITLLMLIQPAANYEEAHQQSRS